MVYLKDILKGVHFSTRDDISDIKVKNITLDSRAVKPQDLFIAITGYSLDGHLFIRDALARGAKVVLAEKDFQSPKGIVKILLNDARPALPVIAANFYGDPSRNLKLIGVTGTNGKTTITYIIENILRHAGFKVGVIGTINYRFKDITLASSSTTPGPLELGSILADMAREDLSHVVMEVSSHALDQHRVGGISFDAAIFTNITSEHLDYHKTLEDYFNAKRRLFDLLKKDGVSILNNDDKKVASLKNVIKNKVITYAIEEDADVKAENIRLSLAGSAFLIVTREGKVEIKTNLIGRHNVSNILASVAASLAQGVGLDVIKKAIESGVYVPGRLEEIDLGQPFKVFIDYAHTEDALYNALSILKDLSKRNIVTLFGCGGDRDRSKRPLMGRVACRFSDKVIITSDNPRSEDPMDIIAEIEKGIRSEFSNYEMFEDRLVAIERAIAIASKGDIVVIAGKGHEKYQILKDKTMPFDDCEVVSSILRRRYAGKRAVKDNSRETIVRRA